MDSRLLPLRSDEVHWRALDSGGVLLDPHSGRTWSLNPVGLFIWDLCDGHVEIRQIRAEMMRYFGVDAATAQRDLEGFLLDLEEHGLVTLSLAAES